MDICKKGKIPKYEATCNECKTEFRFRRSEADIWRNISPRWVAVEVYCPVCGFKCNVKVPK